MKLDGKEMTSDKMEINTNENVILTSSNKIKLDVLKRLLDDNVNIECMDVVPLVEQPYGIKGLLSAAYHRIQYVLETELSVGQEIYALENGLIYGNMFDVAACIIKCKNGKYKAYINFRDPVIIPFKVEIPEGKTIGHVISEKYNVPHDNWHEMISFHKTSRSDQLTGALTGASSFSPSFKDLDEIINYFM